MISVHCRLKVQKRFRRDSPFYAKQDFWCSRRERWTDGGLSSIAVCSLHGCYGSSLYIVVLLLTGFTGELFCCAELVLCFCATSTIRDGGRSPATVEAVSASVGHGQVARGGVRRGRRFF